VLVTAGFAASDVERDVLWVGTRNCVSIELGARDAKGLKEYMMGSGDQGKRMQQRNWKKETCARDRKPHKGTCKMRHTSIARRWCLFRGLSAVREGEIACGWEFLAINSFLAEKPSKATNDLRFQNSNRANAWHEWQAGVA
jgi:hypothetical protein